MFRISIKLASVVSVSWVHHLVGFDADADLMLVFSASCEALHRCPATFPAGALALRDDAVIVGCDAAQAAPAVHSVQVPSGWKSRQRGQTLNRARLGPVVFLLLFFRLMSSVSLLCGQRLLFVDRTLVFFVFAAMLRGRYSPEWRSCMQFHASTMWMKLLAHFTIRAGCSSCRSASRGLVVSAA